MNEISIFLANPIVSLIGYAISLVSGVIALKQASEKNKALGEVAKLKVQLSNITNSNNVNQGNQSQYFKENSGSVHIDNRG